MNISAVNLTSPDFSDLGLFDRYQFVTESPGVAISLIVILLLAGLVGTCGNILILLALCVTKKMKSLESIFIANLAISDMYVTLVADTMSVVAKLEGENFFNLYPGLCQFIAYGCTMSCVNSLGTIALMSFNRYVLLCHHQHYDKIFKKHTCIMMCVSLYCVGLLLVLLNLAGIGDHSFDRKSLECIWDRMATYYYTVVFSVTLVWIPVVVTGFSYLNIYLRVTRSAKRMKKHQDKPAKSSVNLARTLFIIYVVFATCWIPYALIIVVDRNDTFPHEAHLYVTVFAHLHPSINWLVYYFTNTKFHRAFDKIAGLHRVFGICRRSSLETPDSSGVLSTSDSQAAKHKITSLATLSGDELSSKDIPESMDSPI
ncbi:melatonin receptor type 1B-A-like [Saccostrea echinata]|uniref:melatonin receptor type 1B-A-like n=1 Tax=Saccostrea echinata TaxID=191078 RepID=UPI002A7FA500|nr:melatonin receptor type 1B-A-like [Saccostrea echinata]